MRLRHLVATTTLAIAMTVTVPAIASAAALACTWTPSILPVPAAITGSTAITAADSAGGFAGSGQIASRFGGALAIHALRWQGGQVTDYGTVPNSTDKLSVTAVNRDGVVVGTTQKRNVTGTQAFRSRGTVLEALPEP